MLNQKSQATKLKSISNFTSKPRIHRNNSVIDLSGKKHMWIIRGQGYSSSKASKKQETIETCRKCNQTNHYVDVLEQRLETIEQVVNNLTALTISNVNHDNNPTNQQIWTDISNMSIDDLLHLVMNLC
ncbi:hypothetical protein G9A89_011537 [Geosiphon pyriformis]|nr:hypothetical protein G9A89_011537 [Geosiphon pyriformis]